MEKRERKMMRKRTPFKQLNSPSAPMLLMDMSEGAGDTVDCEALLEGVPGGFGEAGDTGGGAAPPAAGAKAGWLIMASCSKLRTSSAVAKCSGVWPSWMRKKIMMKWEA